MGIIESLGHWVFTQRIRLWISILPNSGLSKERHMPLKDGPSHEPTAHASKPLAFPNRNIMPLKDGLMPATPKPPKRWLRRLLFHVLLALASCLLLFSVLSIFLLHLVPSSLTPSPCCRQGSADICMYIYICIIYIIHIH